MVSDPEGQWSDDKKLPGTSYVIGGAGKGIHALFLRYGSGKFTFAELLKGSKNLAAKGFTMSRRYSIMTKSRQPVAVPPIFIWTLRS